MTIKTVSDLYDQLANIILMGNGDQILRVGTMIVTGIKVGRDDEVRLECGAPDDLETSGPANTCVDDQS